MIIFVKVTENGIEYTKEREKATKVHYSDTEKLIPLIEFTSGFVAITEKP